MSNIIIELNTGVTKETEAGKVTLSKSMRNVYKVPDTTARFNGLFYEIQLDSRGEVRFSAALANYETETKLERKSWFNPFNHEHIPVTRDACRWRLNTGPLYIRTKFSNDPNYPEIYFQLGPSGWAYNEHGERSDSPCWVWQHTLPTGEDSYRKALRKLALQQHIDITDNLLDKVFLPLEERVREFKKVQF